MKFDAHPLVVAAAMGLLGPAALASEGDEGEGEGLAFHDAHVAAPPEGWTPAVEPRSSSGAPLPLDGSRRWREPPDPAEMHRVEIEWLKVKSRS